MYLFSGAYGSKPAGAKPPYGKIFFVLFLRVLVWDCKVVDHVLHHNDAGGFGPGGAGLPVVPGGAGYGYPLGTGKCSDELTTCRLFCS